MSVLVGSTTVAWKCDGSSELAWLTHAEEMSATHPDVEFFCALEQDTRGDEPFDQLLARLAALGGTVWRYRWDDGAERITAGNRIARICAGRNMVIDRALDGRHEWILFLDTDLTPPADAIVRLLEVDWPIVGGDVPSYCLGGAEVAHHPGKVDGPPFGFPVQQHWNTAGFLMVHRSLFRRLRWRRDPDTGMTDDPCFAADAHTLGWATLVRKDVAGLHAPCEPIEARGVDMRIHR